MFCKDFNEFLAIAELGPDNTGRHGYTLTDQDRRIWSLMVWGQLELAELTKKLRSGQLSVHAYVIDQKSLSDFIKEEVSKCQQTDHWTTTRTDGAKGLRRAIG